MNKFLAKTIGKWKLWSIIGAVIIVVGVVLAATLGFNLSATADSTRSLTVRISSRLVGSAEKTIESICEDAFQETGIKQKYVAKGTTSGITQEFIYYFDKKTDSTKLTAAKDAIGQKITTAQATEVKDGGLKDVSIYVAANDNVAVENLAKGFIWRGILAAVVAAVAVFVYITLRYKKLYIGALVAFSSIVGGALTLSLTALVRIPVSATVAGAFAFATLYTGAVVVASFAAIRAAEKSGEFEGKTEKEIILSSYPVKNILIFAGVLAVALILLGAIGVTSVRWFAVSAFLSLVCGTLVALVLAPSVYLPIKEASDKKAAEKAQYNYRKPSKKDKNAKNAEESVKEDDVKENENQEQEEVND